MRYRIYALIILLAVSSALSAATNGMRKQLLYSTTEYRIYRTIDESGKTVTVYTNLDENGRRLGGELKTTKTRTERVYVPATFVADNEKRTLGQADRKAARKGIPLCDGCSPNRPVNPFRPVNPLQNPTAIPSTSPQVVPPSSNNP